MQPTLVVLAAGMGSRYGSLKQLDGVGPKAETIMDYSVFDAIRAGFGKIVFIIRERFSDDFKSQVTDKFKEKIKVEFAYQAVNSPIKGIDKLPEREKPWGTAHAVLVARDVVQEPFAVVNADDYYGVEALQIIGDFLRNDVRPDHFCMVGFELLNTLSDNGSVSRGVCEMNAAGVLTTVVERTKIERLPEGIFFTEGEAQLELGEKNLVSMNLWGFHPSIFDYAQEQFIDFVKNNSENPRAEFYIPLVVNNLIEYNKVTVQVLPTSEQWYGVTYKEDKPLVQKALMQLTAANKYPLGLWDS